MPAAQAGYRLMEPVWNGEYTDAEITAREFTEDAVFTAQAVKTWTVSFYGYDGALIETQTIDDRDFAEAPADPVLNHYTFNGWFIAESADDTYSSGTLFTAAEIESLPVTADVIYKAYFTAVK